MGNKCHKASQHVSVGPDGAARKKKSKVQRSYASTTSDSRATGP